MKEGNEIWRETALGVEGVNRLVAQSVSWKGSGGVRVVSNTGWYSDVRFEGRPTIVVSIGTARAVVKPGFRH